MTLKDVVRELCRYRFAHSSEEELQAALAEVLAPLGFQREYHLGAAGRVDFYSPSSSIGVEVKVDSGPGPVVRQLARYAEHPEISGLVLVTTRAAHRAIQIPGDCPLEIVSVGSGL